MRKKNPLKDKSKSFNKILKEFNVEKLARDLQFERRKPRKIKTAELIGSFFLCSFSNSFSLSKWSMALGLAGSKKVSKQAISERINEPFINLLKELIVKGLDKQLEGGRKKMLERFENVLIQDSSCIHLPDALRDEYPGNYSKGQIKSVAKLQVVFNLLKGNYKSFEVTPYSKNDQAASGDILTGLEKGTLIIRDLGYFSLKIFKSIQGCGADFITLLRRDVSIFQADGKPLDLYKKIRNRSFFKQKVLIGRKEKIEVTLIAIKVNDRLAEHRKIRAFKDRDRRKKNTANKLALLGWDIFVCSMDDLSGKEIQDIYRLRWQIEMIFKSWKSHLRIEQNINSQVKKPTLVQAIIYLTFLITILVIMPVYKRVEAGRSYHKNVSLLKLTQMLAWLCSTATQMNEKMFKILTLHTFYDSRKRTNFAQRYEMLT
jgi:hypothetical protein